MCRFKSGIILKNRVVLAPEGNESHSDLLESLNIEDTNMNAMTKFIRAELTPKNGNKILDVNEWNFRVDQDIVPEWYSIDPEKYEIEFREAVREYMKDYMKDITIICDLPWTPIKKDGDKTYYLLNCFLEERARFGDNNNYAESYIRKNLNNSELAENLKKEFGSRLIPITTDLLSLDGLDDYGKCEVDILAIPTIDLYRECRKNIKPLDVWWWLATPNSTSSGYCSDYVHCVSSYGFVNYDWFNDCRAVRPFFILQS